MANFYNGSDVEDFIFDENATFEESCKAKKEDGEIMDDDSDTDEEVKAEVEACGVIECVDDPEVACYRIALENEQNYNMVMTAFMNKEIGVLESTGSEMVYEAADIHKFFSAINAIIEKFWAKVQGVFKAMINKIATTTAANGSFIKKYKGKSMKKPDKKFKGFTFPMGYPDFNGVADLVKDAEGVAVDVLFHAETAEDANEKINKFNEGFEDLRDKMRGCMCGKKGTAVKKESFKAELNKAFYGNEKAEKAEIPFVDFESLISELERGKTSRQHLKKSYDDAKKSITKIKTAVKDTEKAQQKAKDKVGMRAAKMVSDAISSATTIMSQGLSAKTAAITSKLFQDRAMAAAYIGNQPKEEKKSEEKVEHNSAIEDDLGFTFI